jgi:hypothetical protein
MAHPILKRWQPLVSYLLVLALAESAVLLPQPAVGFDLVGRIRSIFVPRRSVGVARGRRTGAAVRDPDLCRPVTLPLTALVPDSDEPTRTVAEYPTFWFYIPYTLKPTDAALPNPAETYQLKFVLQDEQHKDVYQTTFALPDATTPGVMSLRFLSPKAALATGKKYRWYFLIYCNDREEIYEPAFVEGMIQREALSDELKGKIEREDPSKRFLTYADARLWYDMLAALAMARSTGASPVTRSDWDAVLQGSGLDEKLSQQPIVGHYYVPAEP